MDPALEDMPTHAPSLQRSDHPLHHTVLLRAIRCDEYLLQAVAARQARVVAAGEGWAGIGAQQEWIRHASQRAKTGDQLLPQSG